MTKNMRVQVVRKCRILYCRNAHYAKGLCTRHYANWRRSGLIVPSNDGRNLMAMAMNLLKAYVPDADYASAVKESWYSASDDVPDLARQFEELLKEDEDEYE